jgi:hypothetical protein
MMDRKSITRSKSDSFSSILSTLSGKDGQDGKDERHYLPAPAHSKSTIRVRALLGHCLYRRVIIWSVTILVLTCLTLFTGGVRTRHGRILDLVDFRKGAHHDHQQPPTDGSSSSPPAPGDAKKEDSAKEEENAPRWLRYKQ